MTEFVLDTVENPHPKMLARALKLRERLKVPHSPADNHTWHGYLMAMSDATGETPEAIEAWMDRCDTSPAP